MVATVVAPVGFVSPNMQNTRISDSLFKISYFTSSNEFFFFLFDMLNRRVMMVNRSSAKLILQTIQVSVATFLSPPKLHCQLTVEGGRHGKGFYLGFSGMLIPASCINALSHSISAPFSGAHSWAFHTTTRGKKVQTCFCLPVSENEGVLES